MRTRIKICGITRVEDGLQAARLGADAIGLVFYPPSPRHVAIEQAARIVAALPAFVTTVGLFVDAEAADIEAVLSAVPLDLLQFHGDESVDACERHGHAYIKALRMAPGVDVLDLAGRYTQAKGILLDSYQPGMAGGTGQRFDWNRIPSGLDKPLILAGGLEAGNVAEALQQVKPYAVDVSGGVEAEKGIKDIDRMAAFINEVNRVGKVS